MDSVTHTLLGACIGEVLAGKKLGKKAMLYGAIANNLPDIDVLTSLWMNQPDSLLAHRGFTHSILFALLMTPLLGWLMNKIKSRENFSTKDWSILFGTNLFLHLLIDGFTVYGTGWFEPFSHSRISFDLLFVADPFFTISLFVATIALLILKRNSPKRIAWAVAGPAISLLYVVYAIYHKTQVDEVARKSFSKEKITYTKFMATPAPLNNFLWYIVAQSGSGYQVGYYSVFDRDEEIRFHFLPSNDSLLNPVRDHDDVKKLVRFSQGYYYVEKINDTLIFSDVRFGQIGGWSTGDAPFVFRYKLAHGSDDALSIQSGRMKASGSKALSEMIERIKGN